MSIPNDLLMSFFGGSVVIYVFKTFCNEGFIAMFKIIKRKIFSVL